MNIMNQIIEANRLVAELSKTRWWEDVFLSFQWWCLIFSLITPWIIWWRFVDKRRLQEIFLVGMIIMLISLILDQVGASLLLWTYPYTPTPLAREVFDPADLALIPVFYMLIYQLFMTWRSYLIIAIIWSFIASYVGGNIYEWLGIYKLLQWNHIYSVPIYLAMFIFVKWFMNRIDRTQTAQSS